MPKAQVLVTVTAEALVEVPDGVDDVAAYVREQTELAWGTLQVDSTVQPAAIRVEHYFLPEPMVEPEPEENAEPEPEVIASATDDLPLSPDDTLPLPALVAATRSRDVDLVTLFDDPAYRSVIRSAIRERAERVMEDVVAQVVAELEPLLRRHLSKNASGPE